MKNEPDDVRALNDEEVIRKAHEFLITETSFFPDACKHCRNNPYNGGSGFCNCTLGVRTIY